MSNNVYDDDNNQIFIFIQKYLKIFQNFSKLFYEDYDKNYNIIINQ